MNRAATICGVLAGCAALTGTASAKIVLPTIPNEIQHDQAAGRITPPAPPCPEYPTLSCSPLPETPATGVPFPGNMAYYGGHLEIHPKQYLVYWGWGEAGAFPGQSCSSATITEGSLSATLACDPDGAGRRMADFVQQMGGTSWAGVSTQYADASGAHISNDPNVLGGIWVDDSNDITGLPKTNATNPAGPTNTNTDLAAEASRAISHFGITDTANANLIIIQPPAYSDPNAVSQGYCAFHDYTEPGSPGNGYYNDPSVTKDIAYTNMPYQLAINSNGANLCGQNAVNSGAQGKLDGFSIVLGHEIEETITDPGAEAVVGPSGSPTHLGGYYDTLDANENGDKCAWVGLDPATGQGPPVPVPGALGNITGNAGGTFAVQSIWSNTANAGTGYCAGAGTDSPLPNGP
ncbi:MAG TPA: hypothetical protein VGY32_05775 [Solirubrobacteraceae bacterium]|nr:hypothetical protein [Solirubrobacteraceae bacterium]